MRLKLHWVWLIPVLLLSTYLGLLLINYDALWFDEWITLFISGTGKYEEVHQVESLCSDLLSGETHNALHTLCWAAIDNSWPPLYFLLQQGWDSLASQGNYFVDRCLALLFGVLAVAATYRLGRSLYNVKTGLLAALLLGTSVFLTFYMHEIRGYTLYVFLSALNGFLYWHLLTHQNAGRAVRWTFALSIVASLYTHYVSIAVVFGIGLYHVLFERPRFEAFFKRKKDEELSPQANHWLSILKLYINGCLVYSLWLGVLYISTVNSALLERGIPLLDLLQAMMTGFSNKLSIVALAMLLLSLVYLKEQQVRFLWVWALSILVVAIIGNVYADFLFHPRHIMGLMPAFMLLVAVAILRIPKFRTVIASAIVLLWVGAGIYFGQTTALMNSLPMHLDTMPLTAMNSIMHTAESCGTSESTFVLGINTPDEEWVQDQPMNYYLGDFEMRFITLSRIMSDEWSQAQGSPLVPDELETGTVSQRFDYFTDGAQAVYLFTIPERPIQDEIAEFVGMLGENGFVICDAPLYERSDLLGQVFVRDAAQCEAILATCR